MHAPLRRFFERLSNSSNNGGASQPYIHNKRSHGNKKEKIVKDGRWGRLGEETPRQYHKNRMAMQKNEKRKAKTGIMLVSQACGREPQKQENEKIRARAKMGMHEQRGYSTRRDRSFLASSFPLSFSVFHQTRKRVLAFVVLAQLIPGSNLLLWIEHSQTLL